MDLKDTAAVRQVWQRVGLVSAAEKGISLRDLIAVFNRREPQHFARFVSCKDSGRQTRGQRGDFFRH